MFVREKGERVKVRLTAGAWQIAVAGDGCKKKKNGRDKVLQHHTTLHCSNNNNNNNKL